MGMDCNGGEARGRLWELGEGRDRDEDEDEDGTCGEIFAVLGAGR